MELPPGKIDLRVATIKHAELVEGADKLLKLKVSLGDHERTIFSGIRSAYSPESLIGKKTIVVANLKPRKMKFGTSEGMILAASHGDKIHLIEPHDDCPAGSKIS